MKKFIYGLALAITFLSSAQAAELNVGLQIPALNVAEYHRPLDRR
jgi:hypothetical protein